MLVGVEHIYQSIPDFLKEYSHCSIQIVLNIELNKQ